MRIIIQCCMEDVGHTLSPVGGGRMAGWLPGSKGERKLTMAVMVVLLVFAIPLGQGNPDRKSL